MKQQSLHVRWFHENADLILCDLDRSPEGTQPLFYWDTYEVHGAARGYSDLYSKTGEFNREYFDSKDFLVRCLMASGWFGPVRMLEPHKAEFITRLGHVLDARASNALVRDFPPGGAMQFLDTAIPSTSNRQLSIHNIDRFIKEESRRAGDLFKAIQSLGSLEPRISAWKDMDILALSDDPRFDYSRLIADEKFDRLRRLLDVERPATKINNFTDAASLCFLNQILCDAIRDRTPIPILFVSSPIVWKTLSLLQADNFLTYKGKNNRNISVLRRADYYLLRASLWIPERFHRESIFKDPLSDLRQMWEIADSHMEFAKQTNMVGPESVLEIDALLAENIEQLRKLWFLDRIWLPFAVDKSTVGTAAPYIRAELTVLSDAKALAENTRYIHAIRKDALELHGQFEEGARQSVLLSKLLTRLDEAYEKFKLQFAYLVEMLPLSAVNLFGLVRFGLPDESVRILESDFRSLLTSDDSRRSFLGQIVVRCFDVLKGEVRNFAEIGNLALILWILEDDLTIDEMFSAKSKEMPDMPSWIQMVCGASLLRARRSSSKVDLIISQLRLRVDSSRSAEERVQLIIGVAYLNFHAWENMVDGLTWTNGFVRDGYRVRVIDIQNSYLETAFSWALRARNTAPLRSAVYVYTLNMYVFYVTEAANDSDFQNVESYVAELLGYCDDKAVWQYRFSDTLARFYLRRATSMVGAARKDALSRAMLHIRQAERLGRGDRRIANFKDQLELIREYVEKG